MTDELRKHIVIVDDNPVNLDLAENVLKDNYKLTKLISGKQLLKFLARVKPDMILLDVQMPEMNGYEVLTEIKKNPDRADIPVIFLTGQKDIDSEREGFRLGAKDFIVKPFDNVVMLSRIQSQMELYQYRIGLESLVREKARRIEDLQHVITVSWAEVIESRDGTTGGHVRNTTRYFEEFLRILAQHPEYNSQIWPELTNDLLRASSLHDIGKIAISDVVLKKPGPLTHDEFDYMKLHSKIGGDMIQKIIDNTQPDDFLLNAKDMALYHHERWDGSGYPCGLKGEEIPFFVRILTIADVFDALTSVRPYKKAFTMQETMDIMCADRGKFYSPQLFDIFVENSHVMQCVLESKQA